MTKRTRGVRFYYGPKGHETDFFWSVPAKRVRNARANVPINGTVEDAIRAYPGVTAGCALERVARANADAFPHPVYHISVTKSGMDIADSINKDGSPRTAVHYGHRYGNIVDLNDTKELKQLVQKKPEIIARSFVIGPPRKSGPVAAKSRPSPTITQDAGTTKPRRKSTRHVGALARAVRAGHIGRNVAQQLTAMVQRQDHGSGSGDER